MFTDSANYPTHGITIPSENLLPGMESNKLQHDTEILTSLAPVNSLLVISYFNVALTLDTGSTFTAFRVMKTVPAS
jgi:hypothetical protein